MRGLAAACLLLIAAASLGAAEEKGFLSDGVRAEAALGQGLRPEASLDDAYAGGVSAERFLQGATDRSEAVLGDGPSAGAGNGSAGPPPRAGFKARETPPPAIGAPLGPPEGNGVKKKRDWKKLVTTWLPIGIFYYSSVSAILNPLGAAAGFARGMAGMALLGTVLLLYREAKRKKA